MDQFEGCLRLHWSLAPHAESRSDPLPQGPGPGLARIELAGTDAQARPFHRCADQRVARPAGPNEICRYVVFLIAVHVIDFNVSRGPTKRADARPARAAICMSGPVSRRAVADFAGQTYASERHTPPGVSPPPIRRLRLRRRLLHPRPHLRAQRYRKSGQAGLGAGRSPLPTPGRASVTALSWPWSPLVR